MSNARHVLSTLFGAVLATKSLVCAAQGIDLVDAGRGVLVVSKLVGDHVWTGGVSAGRASGEGNLVVFEPGNWTGRTRQLYVEGAMIDGQFFGWVEAYRYPSREYWLGYLAGFLPEGCGVAGELAPNGARIEESLRIERRSRGLAIPDPSRECDQKLEKLLAKKSGKFAGKALVICLLEKTPKCLRRSK
jgi:hypothetical protein